MRNIFESLTHMMSLCAAVALLVVVPIGLILLIIPKTRGYGGFALWITTWPLGLALWMSCALYAFSISIFWSIVGLVFAGIGIIPVALVMSLLRGDWPMLGNIAITGVIILVLRFVGIGFMGRASERKLLADLRSAR